MDTMLKNKVVHLSTIHGKAFEIPPIFFQQANCKFLLQKEIVLLTIRHHQSYWGKKPLFSLRFLLLYKKVKWLGCPKWPLGFPTFSIPNASLLKKAFTELLNYYKVDRSFMRRVLLSYLRTFSTLLLQQQCFQMRMALVTECWFQTFQLGSWWPRSLLGSTEADLIEIAC